MTRTPLTPMSRSRYIPGGIPALPCDAPQAMSLDPTKVRP